MIWSTDFAGPVCVGIGAPFDAVTSNNLWGWSAQEKTGLHPAPGDFAWQQWCNALNTTEKWAGSVDVGAQPGPHDVQAYLSIADGCAATVATLLNGRYPDIVQAFRDSLPASLWGAAARAQLDTWGTGSSWCDFVPIPGEVMAQLDDIQTNVAAIFARADAQYDAMFRSATDPNNTHVAATKVFEAKLKAAVTLTINGVLTPAQQAELDAVLAEAQAAHAEIDAVKTQLGKDLAP